MNSIYVLSNSKSFIYKLLTQFNTPESGVLRCTPYLDISFSQCCDIDPYVLSNHMYNIYQMMIYSIWSSTHPFSMIKYRKLISSCFIGMFWLHSVHGVYTVQCTHTIARRPVHNPTINLVSSFEFHIATPLVITT